MRYCYLLLFILFYLPNNAQSTYLDHNFLEVSSESSIASIIDGAKKKKYKLNDTKVIEFYKDGVLVATKLDLSRVSPYQLRCLNSNEHLRKVAFRSLSDYQDRYLIGMSRNIILKKLGVPESTRLYIDGSDQMRADTYAGGQLLVYREDQLESIAIKSLN